MSNRGSLYIFTIVCIFLMSILISCAHNNSNKQVKHIKTSNENIKTSDEDIEKLAEKFKNHKHISIKRKGTIEINSNIKIAGKGKNSKKRNKTIVNEVIDHHKSAIEYCYRKEVKNTPKLKGKMLITITIMPNGSVKNCKILYSSIRNRTVENCVIKSVRKWKDFPVIDKKFGVVEVDFKYVFY